VFRIVIIILIFLVLTVPAELIEIDNGWVKVVMDDVEGRFGIGKPDGTPYIDGFPTEVTGAHFIAHIDGVTLSNRPGLGTSFTLLDTGRVVEDFFMSIQWIRDPIRIWEKFYLMPEESLDAFCDIEFLAYNDSPDSHSVGFLLYIDPRVGVNDNPVLEFATGVETTSQRFTDADIPAYWTLYENSIHQDTTFALAQGVPFGSSMLYPDIVAFADASLLETDEWPLNILPGFPLSDLAIAIRWNSINLSGYDWYIVQTYYGGGYPGFGIEEKRDFNPEFFSIGLPRPNPFNSRVTVPFEIMGRERYVSWNIYNLSGRVVKHAEPERLVCGDYNIIWDGRDDFARKLPTGMYLFTLFADGRRSTRRLLLVE